MTRQNCPYRASGRSALVLVLLSRLADDITMKGGVSSDRGRSLSETEQVIRVRSRSERMCVCGSQVGMNQLPGGTCACFTLEWF